MREGPGVGYEVQAVIARDELLRAVSRDVPGARVAPLRQGLSLMPMTDEVFDAATDGGTEGPWASGGCREASRSCSPGGPPRARWPMWRPSTSAARVSNAPRSGPTGNWFWDRWTRRRRSGSPGRSVRSRGRYGDSAREGARARTNSAPWDWTAIGATTAGSVELRARGDGELPCVLVTFSGRGSGGIGPGQPAGGARARPDRLRGHALAQGGGAPAAVTHGGDGSRRSFPRPGPSTARTPPIGGRDFIAVSYWSAVTIRDSGGSAYVGIRPRGRNLPITPLVCCRLDRSATSRAVAPGVEFRDVGPGWTGARPMFIAWIFFGLPYALLHGLLQVIPACHYL